ncbi:MAG TPA: hypothetical protein PKI32_10400 [Opitutales bacterium]|nr:hypothetical protein [Opitutales bacterium]
MNDKIARLLSFATQMVLALSLSCGAQPVDNQNDPAFAPEQGAKAPAVLDIPPELEAIASQQPAPRKVPRRA